MKKKEEAEITEEKENVKWAPEIKGKNEKLLEVWISVKYYSGDRHVMFLCLVELLFQALYLRSLVFPVLTNFTALITEGTADIGNGI